MKIYNKYIFDRLSRYVMFEMSLHENLTVLSCDK